MTKKCAAAFPRDKRTAFARRSCANNKLKRDDDSSSSYRALVQLADIGGNRLDLSVCQVMGDRLLIRRDHVIEAMLRGLGARVTPIEAPFEPEPGAYDHDQDGFHV